MSQPLYAISYVQLVDVFAILFVVQFITGFILWFGALTCIWLVGLLADHLNDRKNGGDA